MKIYSVSNEATGFRETYYTLRDAKAAMKAHNARGFITKVYANGDWVPCGEITLKGTNKTFVANSKQTKENY